MRRSGLVGLLGSLGLHALALGGFLLTAPGAPAPGPAGAVHAPLRVGLKDRGAPEASSALAPPGAGPVGAKHRRRPAREALAPQAARPALPEEPAGEASSGTAPAGDEEPAPTEGGGAGPGAPGGERGEPAAPGGGGRELGAGGDGRELELSRRLGASALRCYPRAAARLRLRGEARVRFCLDPGGQLSAPPQLLASAGAEPLDEAAGGCVVQGALPFPGLSGCFQVRVQFGGQR